MKKTYVAPVAEKIKFEYKDQVVVASNAKCEYQNSNHGPLGVCNDEVESVPTNVV